MASNKIAAGRPRGSVKKDYVLYTGGGKGGGGGVQTAGVQEYTYWLDLNPFATFIRKIVIQNVSFEVYSSSDGFGNPTANSEVQLFLRADTSNDCPPEIAMSASEVANGHTLLMDPADHFPNGQRHIAPYYITVQNIPQPADSNFQNDQGRYAYAAYSGSGYNLSSTGAGGYNAIWQSFIPQSPQLTAVWLKRLYRVGSTSDHTQFGNVYVDLYDANFKLVAQVGKLQPVWPMKDGTGKLITNYGTVFQVTADDGLTYWNDIDQISFTPSKPIAVTPNATYYLSIYNDNVKASPTYGVGANNNSLGSYNGLGRYPFGQAYAQSGSPTAPSLGSAGTNMSVAFLTQRNTGRLAYNFYWASSSYLWYNPQFLLDQFKFVSEDFDQRI